MTNLGLSPTGKRVVVEARGEIFTIPAEKGDVRNMTQSSGSAERQPAWSPDGKYVSYFSDKSGEYRLVIEAQDGLRRRARSRCTKPTLTTRRRGSPDSKKLLYHDTNLNVWVLDVESGKAKVVGHDPWMVPQRTLAPIWSPDSKWVAFAYAARTRSTAPSSSRNVDTGETKQVTDGLADAMYPVWDASGKYLWFLASTDFGLRSQWLDMTSYDLEETFGLLPRGAEEGRAESAAARERRGRWTCGARPLRRPGRRSRAVRRAAGDQAEQAAGAKPAPKAPVTVQIDFDGLPQRILAVSGVPARQYAQLRAGAAGSVFYLEARGRWRRGRRQHASPVPPERPAGGGVCPGRRGVRGERGRQEAALPAAGGGGRGAGAAEPGPQAAPGLFLVDADKAPPAAGQGRVAATLRMNLDPKEEFRQIFDEGWRTPARLPLRAQPARHRLAEDEADVRRRCCRTCAHRADLNYVLDILGGEIAIGHSYGRRRHARRASVAASACWAPTSP